MFDARWENSGGLMMIDNCASGGRGTDSFPSLHVKDLSTLFSLSVL